MHIHNRTTFHSGPEDDLVESSYAAGRRLVMMRSSSRQAESSPGVLSFSSQAESRLLAKKRGQAALDAEIEDICGLFAETNWKFVLVCESQSIELPVPQCGRHVDTVRCGS